jgi:hypothetical protein
MGTLLLAGAGLCCLGPPGVPGASYLSGGRKRTKFCVFSAEAYTLSATGWVRAVSGLQSLVSVYLLALWALTYFGRSFE